MIGSKGDAAGLGKLLPELLAYINDRLEIVDRFAFATVLAAYCNDDSVFSKPTPWLLLPCEKEKNSATATLFSVADRQAATVCAPDPALRGYSVLGSSHGWLATADYKGQIHLVKPATGEQHTPGHQHHGRLRAPQRDQLVRITDRALLDRPVRRRATVRGQQLGG
jgi:hypothetical protein